MRDYKTGDVISFTLTLGKLNTTNGTFEIKGTDLTVSSATLDKMAGVGKTSTTEVEKVTCRPYRRASKLLREPDDMTEKEKERLKRIEAIPDCVRHACELRAEAMRCAVMKLEKELDALNDYLNGEEVSNYGKVY